VGCAGSSVTGRTGWFVPDGWAAAGAATLLEERDGAVLTKPQMTALMVAEKTLGRKAAQRDLAEQLCVPVEDAVAIFNVVRQGGFLPAYE
jgi:hypothetical protein